MSCDTPLTISIKEGYFDPVNQCWTNKCKVPCGKCLPCKQKRVNQWAFRLMHEKKRSYSAYFVTLTYNTDYVPITKRGFMTLVKTTEQYKNLPKQHRYEDKDVSCQGFIKRLRYYEQESSKKGEVSLEQYKRAKKTTAKLFPDVHIKYYAVGEYGSRRSRPHLHLILFNIVNPNNIKLAWTFGECHIDEVNSNTVEYTLKYICKPPGEKRKGFDGIKEFSLMSKGLGENYFNHDAKRFHSQDYANYVVNSKGIKVPLPRYYSSKINSITEKPEYSKEIKEKKAIFMAVEYQKREDEQKRLLAKEGKSYAEIKVKIAMANKAKLSRPLKERGND